MHNFRNCERSWSVSSVSLMPSRGTPLFLCLMFLSFGLWSVTSAASSSTPVSVSRRSFPVYTAHVASSTTALFNVPRGGASNQNKTSKQSSVEERPKSNKKSKKVGSSDDNEKKKGKKSKTNADTSSSESSTASELESKSESESTATPPTKGKDIISDTLKQTDSPEALGDAIRDRADILRAEDPFLQSIHSSVSSVGHALGASDFVLDESGVETATSSVIAHYFLQSHGGAHVVQCICSAFCSLSGFGVLALYPKRPVLTYTLLQRTFLFAMLKHVSGMVAAASVAAKAIPKIGLSKSRQWMEQLVMDPVSQYVFFNALMIVWLSSQKRRFVLGTCWWWGKSGLLPVIMLGPVLLREIISTMLVISDVLVLWTVGSTSNSGIESLLKISNALINAVMSLLVTPTVWRGADATKRQAILSKLVSRVSLVSEVFIGALLLIDAIFGILSAAFLSGVQRPPFKENLTKMVCVRLFVHFLWIRRSKIKKVGLKIRGGASKLPLYILDSLYEPGKALGIRPSSRSTMAKDDVTTAKSMTELDELPWWEQFSIAVGLTD